MRVCFAIALVLSCSIVGSHAADACNGQDIGNSGEFDFYVLQQVWPAQYCCAWSTYPGCVNPTPWQLTNFTINGFWPYYNQQQNNSNAWFPQCCHDSPDNFTLSDNVIQALLPQLQKYWPDDEDVNGQNDTSLWYNEWQKHGTCSGLKQHPYMQAAMTVAQSPSLATPDIVSSEIGSTVDLQALYEYYGASSKCGFSDDCMVGIQCAGTYLYGITTCWSKSLTRIVCPSAVVGGLQNCQRVEIDICPFHSNCQN